MILQQVKRLLWFVGKINSDIEKETDVFIGGICEGCGNYWIRPLTKNSTECPLCETKIILQ
jgi:hypothetical protein